MTIITVHDAPRICYCPPSHGKLRTWQQWRAYRFAAGEPVPCRCGGVAWDALTRSDERTTITRRTCIGCGAVEYDEMQPPRRVRFATLRRVLGRMGR